MQRDNIPVHLVDRRLIGLHPWTKTTIRLVKYMGREISSPDVWVTVAIVEYVENPPDSPADHLMASKVIRIKWPEFEEIACAKGVLDQKT